MAKAHVQYIIYMIFCYIDSVAAVPAMLKVLGQICGAIEMKHPI